MGFFKAYDMRGTFGVDFDVNTAFRVGRALPSVIARLDGVEGRRPRILVGRDGKVIDADAKGARLRQLLEAAFE